MIITINTDKSTISYGGSEFKISETSIGDYAYPYMVCGRPMPDLNELTVHYYKRPIITVPEDTINPLEALHDDLGKLKWIGTDEGWELAIESVRTEIRKRIRC